MANIDQEFVEFVVKSLVNEPEKVKIERSIDEKGVLLELTVAPDDLGRVIGKRGNTAQSIRTLLRALGTKNDARYNLKIVDVTGGTRPPRRDDNHDNNNDETTASTASDDNTQSATSDNSSQSDGASQWAHLSSSNDDSGDDDQDAVDEQSTEENKEKSVVEKTREELADLDDLDI